MKRLFAIIIALIMAFCFSGCKNETDSSEVVDIEYEEIIINETSGTSASSNINDSQTNKTNNQNKTSSSSIKNSSKTAPLSSAATDSKPADFIDYDNVVEIDICPDIVRTYLSATNAKSQFVWLKDFSGKLYDYQYLNLNWPLDESSEYSVYFSEKSNFSNAIIIKTDSRTLKNTYLIPGKTYYWKVIGNITSKILGGGKIKLNSSPVRWIKIDGTGNVRDMGGWQTTNGKTVKYGMLYRGQHIDNISADGISTIKQLGLKTELDLRGKSQKNQKAGTGMNYVFLDTGAQYDRIFDEDYSAEVKNNYKQIFTLLSDKKNYPFYTHCHAGADRTGTFAFLLNGVLGVSYEDLTRDFELTSFSSSGKRWRSNGPDDTDGQMNVDDNYVTWGKLYDKMLEYGVKNGCSTLQDSIEHFLINYVGVPKAQIESFRSIMLD